MLVVFCVFVLSAPIPDKSSLVAPLLCQDHDDILSAILGRAGVPQPVSCSHHSVKRFCSHVRYGSLVSALCPVTCRQFDNDIQITKLSHYVRNTNISLPINSCQNALQAVSCSHPTFGIYLRKSCRCSCNAAILEHALSLLPQKYLIDPPHVEYCVMSNNAFDPRIAQPGDVVSIPVTSDHAITNLTISCTINNHITLEPYSIDYPTHLVGIASIVIGRIIESGNLECTVTYRDQQRRNGIAVHHPAPECSVFVKGASPSPTATSSSTLESSTPSVTPFPSAFVTESVSVSESITSIPSISGVPSLSNSFSSVPSVSAIPSPSSTTASITPIPSLPVSTTSVPSVSTSATVSISSTPIASRTTSVSVTPTTSPSTTPTSSTVASPSAKVQTNNSKILTWGYNANGQLGDGSVINRLTPTAVAFNYTLGNPSDASLGFYHSLAVVNGKVVSWGFNFFGQLGDGTTVSSLVPILVSAVGPLQGKEVVAVSAGRDHSLALTSDGSVVSWGFGNNGRLGDGGTTTQLTPVTVQIQSVIGASRVMSISAGYEYSLALTSDGRIFSWGDNSKGQLGIGDQVVFQTLPTAVYSDGALRGKFVVEISAGGAHALAVSTDGMVFGWGYNEYGHVGDGTTSNVFQPVAVIGGALAGVTVKSVGAGYYHSLALATDGRVFAWGFNGYGWLGIASNSDSTQPSLVVGTAALNGKKVLTVSAGHAHSMATTADGVVVSWGYNGYGQLGDGTTVDKSSMTVVNVPLAPVAVRCGYFNSVALTTSS